VVRACELMNSICFATVDLIISVREKFPVPSFGPLEFQIMIWVVIHFGVLCCIAGCADTGPFLPMNVRLSWPHLLSVWALTNRTSGELFTLVVRRVWKNTIKKAGEVAEMACHRSVGYITQEVTSQMLNFTRQVHPW
jgi:hypothetical protein